MLSKENQGLWTLLKLSANNCNLYLCMMRRYNFPSLEPTSQKMLSHDNVPVHMNRASWPHGLTNLVYKKKPCTEP